MDESSTAQEISRLLNDVARKIEGLETSQEFTEQTQQYLMNAKGRLDHVESILQGFITTGKVTIKCPKCGHKFKI
jgi:hypothetical protein